LPHVGKLRERAEGEVARMLMLGTGRPPLLGK
jgi:hypothetical protein